MPTLAISSENRMTPMAMEIAASRAGKGELSGMSSGSVRIPASVMAPRAPAAAVRTSKRVLGTRRVRPRHAAPNTVMRIAIQTQKKRSAPSPSVISSM